MPAAMPVISLLVWSKLKRAEYCRSRRSMSGTFSDTSHVALSSWPAFFHWLEKPDDAGGGTCSSSLVTMPCACVTVSPYLCRISASKPSSTSVESSGRRFTLPSVFADTAPLQIAERLVLLVEGRAVAGLADGRAELEVVDRVLERPEGLFRRAPRERTAAIVGPLVRRPEQRRTVAADLRVQDVALLELEVDAGEHADLPDRRDRGTDEVRR